MSNMTVWNNYIFRINYMLHNFCLIRKIMEHAGIDAISNDDFKCYLLLWNDSLRDLALIHPSTFFLDIVNVSNTSGVPAFTPRNV